MTDQDKHEIIRKLHQLAALVDEDAAVGFSLVAVFGHELIADVVALMPAPSYADRMLQLLDEQLFKLKLNYYLRPTQDPSAGGGRVH